MSSLAVEVSSEKPLELQLTCESHHETIFSEFESFGFVFQGTIFDILINSSKDSLDYDLPFG